MGIAAGVLIILGAVAALFYIKKLKAARASAVVDKDLNKSAPPPSVASVNSMDSMSSMSSIFSVPSMASSVMDAPSRGKRAVMFNQGVPSHQQHQHCIT